VILLDANLLLYAYNASFPQHERARQWLEEVLSGTQLVGLPWATVLAFLRIATHPRAFESPLSPDEARASVKRCGISHQAATSWVASTPSTYRTPA